MNDEQKAKAATSFRLTAEAIRLLRALAVRLGVTNSAVIELAIRELARRHKVE